MVALREPDAEQGCSLAWIWRKGMRLRGRLCGLSVDGFLLRSKPQSCPESPLRLASLGNSRRIGCESRSMSGQTLPGRCLLWLSNPFWGITRAWLAFFVKKRHSTFVFVSFLCKLCKLRTFKGCRGRCHSPFWRKHLKRYTTVMNWFLFLSTIRHLMDTWCREIQHSTAAYIHKRKPIDGSTKNSLYFKLGWLRHSAQYCVRRHCDTLIFKSGGTLYQQYVEGLHGYSMIQGTIRLIVKINDDIAK